MRAFAAALLLCVLVFPAHAGWMIPGDGSSHHKGAYHEARIHPHGLVRNHETGFTVAANNRVHFSECDKYGRKPCGCTASMLEFGKVIPGLPAVSQWLRFPRTSPHIDAAAIWPGRHVEIVSAVNGDNTVDTKGSVGWRHVSVARLIFVDPRASRLALRVRRYRYANL